jgi:uncharacterized oxidoreductase
MSIVLLDAQGLERALKSLLAFHGCAPTEAGLVARHLVEADLLGHSSHGAGLAPKYVANIAAGEVIPNRQIERVSTAAPGFLLFDGGFGFGQSLGVQLVDALLPHARETGGAMFGLRRAHHLGRIGAYGELFAEAGFASVLFVNTVSRAIVAPFGGAAARLGTNPICITAPRKGLPPIVLDFATSTIAVGKCRVAREKGEALSPGLVIDAAGEPSTDPGVLYATPQGALRAMGEHKGSGLNLVCELLAACIGGTLMRDAQAGSGGAINNIVGMCFRAEMVPGAAANIEAVVEYFLATPPARRDGPVKLPGDVERESAAALRAGGVPMAADSWSTISALALAAGVTESEIRSVCLSNGDSACPR